MNYNSGMNRCKTAKRRRSETSERGIHLVDLTITEEFQQPSRYTTQPIYRKFVDDRTRVHSAGVDLDPQSSARRRLAYDELLAGQLSLALVRSRMRKITGKALIGNGNIRADLLQRSLLFFPALAGLRHPIVFHRILLHTADVVEHPGTGVRLRAFS